MAGRGGIRSTSFKKGEGGKPLGAKNQTTKVKEAIGLTGWEALCEFIKNDGADKFMEEMMKLKGYSYINAYATLAEYVKPKLARTVIAGDKDNPLQITGVTII